jgi:hypothetical protein
MLYLMKVYALVAFVVFGAAGFAILFMFGWLHLKEYASARRRIQWNLSRLLTEPLPLSNRFAISRSFSRTNPRIQLVHHKTQ